MPQNFTIEILMLVQVIACSRQQTITWAKVKPYLWHQMACLGLYVLTHLRMVTHHRLKQYILDQVENEVNVKQNTIIPI